MIKKNIFDNKKKYKDPVNKKTQKNIHYHNQTETAAVKHPGGQLSQISLHGTLILAFLRHVDTTVNVVR